MITYTSSDIIKRATQLADLENSDFISFSEKIALLNESYVKLYQILVNKGDNNFIRLIKTNSTIIELPPDFWQLKSVTLNTYGRLTPVLRRPANQSLNQLSYDLLNNVLKVYGNQTSAQIDVEYYPIPKTLTFPNEPFELSATNIVDGYNDLYLVKVSEDHPHFVLYSYKDSAINEEIDIDSDEFDRVHMEDDYITFESDTEVIYYSLLTGETYRKNIAESLPVFYRGKTFYYSDADKTLRFVDSESIAYDGIECVSSIENVVSIIMSRDLKHCITLTEDGSIYRDGTEHVELKKVITKIYYDEGDDTVICTSNSNYVATVSITYNGLQEDLLNYNILSVVSIDDNTGYGYLSKKLSKYYITSYYEDTRLNFPNNMYFTLLSYQLAIAFKVKQGSDSSQLIALYGQAEDTFFDTLTKDDWNCVRITNVY